MSAPRWAGDTRGTGIASGAVYSDDIGELLTTLLQTGWVAEDPDLHLLPHLRRIVRQPKSPWTVDDAALREDGVYMVDLTWKRNGAPIRRLHADLFALVGEIAESATYIRQSIRETVIEYRVVTGMLAADTPFAGHGHLLLFRIHGEHVSELIAGTKTPTVTTS